MNFFSADISQFSKWQRRTYYSCLVMFAISMLLCVVGIVFIILAEFFGMKSFELIPSIVFGGETLVAGVVGLAVAISGIIGAKDPSKITLFFWFVTLDGLLALWDLASKISQAQLNPAAVLTLAILLFLVVCAWNVRGQTGYFDHHPHPEDEQD